jgi:hypothetical protein
MEDKFPADERNGGHIRGRHGVVAAFGMRLAPPSGEAGR